MTNLARAGFRVGVSSMAIALVLSGQARAEDTASDSEDVLRADTVIVTATRREETVQDLPFSVTAVNGDDLAEQGVSDYEDLVRTIPGVVATGLSSINKLTIRGIETSQTTSALSQNSVAIYRDDLPLTTLVVVTPDLTPYDVARVEVLRGPQGTLFGAGSLAGAVRYISNTPDTNDYQATIHTEFGASDGQSYRRRVNGMVNLPIAQDRLALRVVGTYKDDDGYVDNLATGQNNANSQNNWGARAALRWEPTDLLTATLTGSYNSNELDDTPLYDPNIGFRKSSSDLPFRVKTVLNTIDLVVDYGLGWANLNSSTIFSDASNEIEVELLAIAPPVPFYLDEKQDIGSVVQELRLVSNTSGPFDWVAGAYYLRQEMDYRDVLYFSTPFIDALQITGLPTNLAPGSAATNFDETRINKELAGFGEVGYQFNDTLKLTLGVRVADSIFTTRVNGESFDAPSAFFAIFTGGNQDLPIVPRAEQEFTTGHVVKVTPKISLTWQPSDDHTLYGTASQGYRRGQPNGVVALNGGTSTIDPNDPAVIPVSADGDSLWNYEIGAKSIWLDGRLRTNLAAYYIDWSNMQVPLVRSSDQAPYVGNIGKARSVGFEGEIAARPTDQLELGLNFSINEAKVVEISAEQALISGALKDAKLASPEFKIGGFVKHSWNLGAMDDLYVRLDAQYVGSFPNSFPNKPGTGTPSLVFAEIPSYEKVDFSLGWDHGNVGAVLYVDNLLDTNETIFINPVDISFNRYGTLRPRTIGVRANWKY
jgi:iron complex outermembrane recepter protein